MSTEEKKERNRKPKARRTDVVIALIEENVAMLAPNQAVDTFLPRRDRMLELLDELKRSMGRRGEDSE